jgi:hypothetical protein
MTVSDSDRIPAGAHGSPEEFEDSKVGREAAAFADLEEGQMKRLPSTPWTLRLEYGTQGPAYHAIFDAGGNYIASTWSGPNEPLARAIAAIPDMLAEIERYRTTITPEGLLALEVYDENVRLHAINAEMRKALAAVQQTRGRPLRGEWLNDAAFAVAREAYQRAEAILAKTESEEDSEAGHEATADHSYVQPSEERVDAMARAIYELEPFEESGEWVDGIQVSPGGKLTWDKALARDAEFGDDPGMGKITEFPLKAARAALAAIEKEKINA